MIAYSVAQRVREIGIRMVLGAGRGSIFRMILTQGLRLGLIGLAIGTAAALALTRILKSFSSLLYGVSANDPVTFVTVGLISIASRSWPVTSRPAAPPASIPWCRCAASDQIPADLPAFAFPICRGPRAAPVLRGLG